jgi:hypothetical protein
MSREISGFWWTWVEGQEWPSWYYSEKTALDRAKQLAMQHPGRKVYVGDLDVVKKMHLPDKLVEA